MHRLVIAAVCLVVGCGANGSPTSGSNADMLGVQARAKCTEVVNESLMNHALETIDTLTEDLANSLTEGVEAVVDSFFLRIAAVRAEGVPKWALERQASEGCEIFVSDDVPFVFECTPCFDPVVDAVYAGYTQFTGYTELTEAVGSR